MKYLEQGKFFKELRERNKLTLKTAAEATGLDKTYLSKIENGHDKPSDTSLQTLIRVYKVSPEDIALLSKYPNNYAPIVTQGVVINEDTLQKKFVSMNRDVEPSSKINSNNLDGKEINTAMTEQNKPVANTNMEVQLQVPENVQVLYTDLAHVTNSKYGIVLDFAQSIGPTNIRRVVARIGMSKEHASELVKVLKQQLEAKEEDK